MIKKRYLFPLLITLSARVYAVENLERQRLFKTPDPKSLTPGQLEDNKEVFLFDESVLFEDKGGYSEASYTGTDLNRFSLGAHVSSNYDNPGELTSLEILFSRQLRTFTEVWISFMAKSTRAKYEALADEIDSANGDIQRDGSDQTFTTLAVGGGYRFKLFAKALGFNRIFETTDAFLTYNLHLDGAEDTRYQGFGLQADYGLHYRAAESFFYGAKFSYNIATVERAEEDGEKLRERSLVFGWLSVGLELGYYY